MKGAKYLTETSPHSTNVKSKRDKNAKGKDNQKRIDLDRKRSRALKRDRQY